MTAIFMIIRHVTGQESVELGHIENNHSIQQFAPDRTHPTFRDAIGMNLRLRPMRPVLPEWSESSIRFILCSGGSTD